MSEIEFAPYTDSGLVQVIVELVERLDTLTTRVDELESAVAKPVFRPPEPPPETPPVSAPVPATETTPVPPSVPPPYPPPEPTTPAPVVTDVPTQGS